MEPLKKNQEIDVLIETFNSNAEGVGRLDFEGRKMVVFVKNALPGEKVKVNLIKINRNYVVGKLLFIYEETLHPRRAKVDEDMKIAMQLGTMPLLHMEYSLQVEFKEQLVRDALTRIGGFSLEEEVKFLPCIEAKPSERLAYRNKASVPVRQCEGQLSTGFFRAMSHDFLPVENFHIQHKALDETIIYLRNTLKKAACLPYDERRHEGDIRSLVLRHTEEGIQAVIVTLAQEFKGKADFVRLLAATAPQNLIGVIQNINPQQTNVIFGKKDSLLYGKDLQSDSLLACRLSMNYRSFYQVNRFQTPVLYEAAFDLLEKYGFLKAHNFKKGLHLVDAYCGVGSIGICLAEYMRARNLPLASLLGVEIVEDAVSLARLNARQNKLENTRFVAGACEEVFKKMLASEMEEEMVAEAELLIVDPARKGLDFDFVCSLKKLPRLQKMLYISCNPATLARDLSWLKAELNFVPLVVQAVDMFPYTSHVETVALLSKLDVDKHISVKIEMDELDLTSAESKATYAQIKEYILEKFDLNVSTLYIA